MKLSIISKESTKISLAVLLILHLVGIVGLLSPYQELFLRATGINLLLTAFFLFLHHKDWNRNFRIFSLLCLVVTFALEVIGVATGDIFGEYFYGNPLGIKLLGVPLIIGVNWVMLIYVVGIIANKISGSTLVKSLSGAALLLLFDFVMEPIAMHYNFWIWEDGMIPTVNYLAWFTISFIFLLIFYKSKFQKKNPLAIPVYLIQFAFFSIINLYFLFT